MNDPKAFYFDIKKLYARTEQVGWKRACCEILHPETPGIWQFLKYLFIGGVSVLVFYGCYGIFRLTVEFVEPGLFISQRLTMNLAAIFIAFVPTNWFTYNANRRWVFKVGRHGQKKEFTLFTLAAACSFFAGQFLAAALILRSPLSDFVITLLVILVSTVVNFFFRKFVVFHN